MEKLTHEELRSGLLKLVTGRCSCMTKTPELKHHDRECQYRIVMEAIEAFYVLKEENKRFTQWFNEHASVLASHGIGGFQMTPYGVGIAGDSVLMKEPDGDASGL